LSEATHVIGQQSAFAERKVQHAVTLVGQQRTAQHVDRLPPGADLFQEMRARFDPRRPPPRLDQPGLEVPRDADPVPRAGVGTRYSLQQGLDPIGRGIDETAIAGE
jgi:hypothetical protein